MDNLPTLMSEIRSNYADDVPLEVLEAYCRRYLHYYHRHVETQPVRFYGAWGWSEARRREFRRAFDLAVGRVTAPQFDAFSSIEFCRHSFRE